jgi:phage terminase large subunit-like protein
MRDLLVRHTSFGPKIRGVTQTSDKAARIAAFSVVVENGAFRLCGDEQGVDASQRELYEEMIGFPFVDLNDLVDAAATGTTYLLTRREPMIW